MNGSGSSPPRDVGILRRVPGYPFHVQTTTSLPADLTAAGAARTLIRTWLPRWGLSHLQDDAELVASELVANAMRHGAAPVTLTIGSNEGHLVLAVEDAAATLLPIPRQASDEATGGRGMILIGALSARWGCSAGTYSKVVWAELAA